jgi:glycosyltransferase involved in cell wall biosynthesis
MHPVSAEERAHIRARLGVGRDDFIVAYVGTFNDKKNQLEFIDLAADPLLAGGRGKLFFVGDAAPGEEVYARRCHEAAARRVHSDRIHFANFSETPEDWYRAADVVCLASRTEGLSRAMIESLSCGTPVVSFDVSSASEILERHACGAVVRQGEYRSLVARILTLEREPEVRARLGSTAARTARALFDPDRSVSAYADLYRELGARVDTIRSISSPY